MTDQSLGRRRRSERTTSSATCRLPNVGADSSFALGVRDAWGALYEELVEAMAEFESGRPVQADPPSGGLSGSRPHPHHALRPADQPDPPQIGVPPVRQACSLHERDVPRLDQGGFSPSVGRRSRRNAAAVSGSQ